jgi:hypothetical protein
MMEVAVMIAKMMPEKELIKMLIEECKEYEALPEDSEDRKEAFKKIAANCTIVTLKMSFEDKDIVEAIEEVEDLGKIHKIGSGIVRPDKQ